MYDAVKRGAREGKDLRTVYRETYAALKPRFGHWVIFDHCLPFDVSRAYDEATEHPHPRIWTAERDKAMWEALEGRTRNRVTRLPRRCPTAMAATCSRIRSTTTARAPELDAPIGDGAR